MLGRLGGAELGGGIGVGAGVGRAPLAREIVAGAKMARQGWKPSLGRTIASLGLGGRGGR